MNCIKCNAPIEDSEHHAILSYQHEIRRGDTAEVTDAQEVAAWCKRCAPGAENALAEKATAPEGEKS